jgi:hypothetical protein
MSLNQKLNALQTNLLCETRLNVPHKVIDDEAIKMLSELEVKRTLKKIIAMAGFLTMRHTLTETAMVYDVQHSYWSDRIELLPTRYISRPPDGPGADPVVVPYGTPCFTPLKDGRVLVCTGNETMRDLRAYFFDPAKEGAAAFVDAPTAAESAYLCRMDASLLTLHDGRILRLGGWANVAVYAENAVGDPTGVVWKSFEPTIKFPSAAFMVVLGSGDVLVTGGFYDLNDRQMIASCDIYRVATGKYEQTGSMNEARAWHSGCLMANGNVFVCGGTDKSLPPSVEIPEISHMVGTKKIVDRPRIPPYPVRGARSTLVPGADEYNPTTGKWTRMSLYTELSGERQQCTLLDDGSIFISSDMVASRYTKIYDPVKKRLYDGPDLQIEYGGFISIPVYT